LNSEFSCGLTFREILAQLSGEDLERHTAREQVALRKCAVALGCSVLHCVAVWCSVLQCGAVCCTQSTPPPHDPDPPLLYSTWSLTHFLIHSLIVGALVSLITTGVVPGYK